MHTGLTELMGLRIRSMAYWKSYQVHAVIGMPSYAYAAEPRKPDEFGL